MLVRVLGKVEICLTDCIPLGGLEESILIDYVILNLFERLVIK